MQAPGLEVFFRGPAVVLMMLERMNRMLPDLYSATKGRKSGQQ